MKALLLVDLQIDFCPGGALEIPHADEVIPIANQLMPHFPLVIATQDWHPADHGSFAANHLWRKPGQVIELNGLKQTLWTMHCVQNSFGALLHPTLNKAGIHKIIQKGTDKDIDSYSSFFDNGHRKATGLEAYLREQGVQELYVMGLATDYCVYYTVLDALNLGFNTHLIIDGCRAIELEKGDAEAAIADMKEKGVKALESKELLLLSD